MSKIEDYAVQLYTTPSSGAFGTGDYEPAEVDIECVHAFVKGYHQAEKDNELTWEDVREMCKQSVLVEIDLGRLVSDERHYTEVLKRFKARKEK